MALKPGEIGAIQLHHVRRTPSGKPGVDLWSLFIPTRTQQRQEVFLLPQIVALLCQILPAHPVDFDTFVARQPEAYLLDILDSAPGAKRADPSRPPTAQALSNWLKPVFKKAAQNALRACNIMAAQRLENATLFWLSNAFEAHLDQKGKAGLICWNTLGACKLWPVPLIDYLPDRRRQSVADIDRSLLTLAATLDGWQPV